MNIRIDAREKLNFFSNENFCTAKEKRKSSKILIPKLNLLARRKNMKRKPVKPVEAINFPKSHFF